jgi:hypothetical protein
MRGNCAATARLPTDPRRTPIDSGAQGWKVPPADESRLRREGTGVEMFRGVKIFSATKAKEREDLGEQVTRWLLANQDLEVVDRSVLQSSDDEFHCLTVVLFYRPRPAA